MVKGDLVQWTLVTKVKHKMGIAKQAEENILQVSSSLR